MNVNDLISRQFPVLQSLRTYGAKQVKGDLSAGITVGVMLIPQGMAYAMIAGLPPIYGLYASTLPLVIYALLGSSRHLAVGPVAMVSLLTAAGIGSMATAGTETYIMLALSLALLVGLIQFSLGLFRLGFLVNFLSHPVISGFTSAAALIIGISQLKHLLGMDIPRSHYVHETLGYAMGHLEQISWPTFIMGLGAILLIWGIKKMSKSFPGALLAVIAGILAVWFFGLADKGIQIVGSIPQGLPRLSIPALQGSQLASLMPVALTIALVSFMESIAVAKAVQSRHKNYKIDPNRELIALGLANIGGSFAQSYPVTGGFSRTAVNDQAGAQTSIASLISVAVIILTLLFFTPLFYFLPNAILAAVILVAVFGLIDIKEPRFLWRTDRNDFWMLVATFAGTLFLGIEMGIGVGVILSLVMLIHRTSRPHVATLGRIPDTPYYRNTNRYSHLEDRADLLIVRFDAQLYFANTGFFKDTLAELEAGKGEALKGVIINADSINNLDSTAIHTIKDLVQDYRARHITILFSGVKGPVRDLMERGGLTKIIGQDQIFLSVDEAVKWFDHHNLREKDLQERDVNISHVAQD